MIISMLVLTALVGVGGLSVLAVRGGLIGSGQERFKTVALYAAESGASVAMDYLRTRITANGFWSEFVTQRNINPIAPPGLPGNNAQPGTAGNLFSLGMPAWYRVRILNNEDDPGFDAGVDGDGRVIIEVTGFGPNGVAAQIRWEVAADSSGLGQICGGAAGQAGGGAEGTGNDCSKIPVNWGSQGSNTLGNP